MPTTFNAVPSPNILVLGAPQGSACCVWKDGISSYVLSAAHVFEGHGPDTAVQWIGGGSVGFGLTTSRDLYWMAVPGGLLDAGLARITGMGVFAGTTHYPWAGQVMEWHEIPSVRSVVICGKFGIVFSTFHSQLAAGARTIPDTSDTYGRLVRLRYDTGSTMDGDSGAAILSLPEGKLVGLHIGRDIDRRFSLAVPAADVRDTFKQKLFGFELRP